MDNSISAICEKICVICGKPKISEAGFPADYADRCADLAKLQLEVLKIIFKPLNNIGGFFVKSVFLRGFEKNLPQTCLPAGRDTKNKGYYPVNFCFVHFVSLWEKKIM